MAGGIRKLTKYAYEVYVKQEVSVRCALLAIDPTIVLLGKTKVSSIKKTVTKYLNKFLLLFMIENLHSLLVQLVKKKCDNEKNVIRNFVS